jgi:hypothetical protein
MSIGDRVVIGDKYTWKAESGIVVMTYLPKVDATGNIDIALDGSVSISNAGGVRVGSTGTIHGAAIKVHRSALHDSKDYSTGLGNDYVQLFPIFLDTYQRVGYFPTDYLRLVGSFAN